MTCRAGDEEFTLHVTSARCESIRIEEGHSLIFKPGQGMSGCVSASYVKLVRISRQRDTSVVEMLLGLPSPRKMYPHKQTRLSIRANIAATINLRSVMDSRSGLFSCQVFQQPSLARQCSSIKVCPSGLRQTRTGFSLRSRFTSMLGSTNCTALAILMVDYLSGCLPCNSRCPAALYCPWMHCG